MKVMACGADITGRVYYGFYELTHGLIHIMPLVL
jgi:hypothetical protein